MSQTDPGFCEPGCLQPGHVRCSYQELCGGGGCGRLADPGVQPQRPHLGADSGAEAQTPLVLAEAQIYTH